MLSFHARKLQLLMRLTRSMLRDISRMRVSLRFRNHQSELVKLLEILLKL